MRTGKKLLNMQAQLEYLGKRIETFSRLHFNTKQTDTIGFDFKSTLQDLDGQQNTNKYIWKHRDSSGELVEGLTDYLPSWLVEYMLYARGSLCGFMSGGALYILPYAQQDGVNIYGMPNAVQPITFNGAMAGNTPQNNFGKQLNINNFGDPNKKASACILYDRIPVWSANSSPISRAALNAELVDYQCEILGRVKNQLKNIDKKVVFWVDSEAQKRQMENDIRDAYGRDDPFIVAVRGSQLDMRGNNTDTLQGDISNEVQSLFETWQSVNSIRCMCSGISNGGAFEKKERVITDEINTDSVQTTIVIDAGLKMRQLFLEQMRRIYPNTQLLKDITVEINERGLTDEERDTDESTGGDAVGVEE